MLDPLRKYGFDSGHHTVLAEIYWRMNRDAGTYHPLPLTPSGWYTLDHPAIMVALFQRIDSRKN